ncbi:MAG: hypothetical protein DRQ65_04260 [Gammaproteobacteria bacterium]|nr:MAG: hypothetical protein DRQ98_10965 [Gammaproteobacteria bacterium]RLA55551.1 MAG: hypothetical protein DRQ65_04260 [Gammaproteobacteria bacterium]HDY81915.1 hypothetical protein [Halieaceae bacterium]
MTIEQLGGLGEFIGAMAVVVSLIFIALEIRSNSRSTRLAALQTAMESSQRIIELPARDRDLSRVIRIGSNDPDSLTEDEYAQYRYWLILSFRSTENLFVQYKSGGLDHETWVARAGASKWMMATPGGSKVWASASNRYRVDFQKWMGSSEKQ